MSCNVRSLSGPPLPPGEGRGEGNSVEICRPVSVQRLPLTPGPLPKVGRAAASASSAAWRRGVACLAAGGDRSGGRGRPPGQLSPGDHLAKLPHRHVQHPRLQRPRRPLRPGPSRQVPGRLSISSPSQEVHGPRPWQTLDQAGELGKRLASAWLFAPNTRAWHCLDSGNGLLSRLPVASWQSIPLPNYGGRGHRNAVLVELKHGGRTIRTLLTHIARGDPEEGRRQLRTVISLYLALSEPAILLGDLNSTGDDPQIRRLLAVPGVSDAVGKVLGAKDRPGRIDWIIARGLRPVNAGIRDNEASDHPAVWAELE